MRTRFSVFSVIFIPSLLLGAEVRTKKSADGWRLEVDGKPYMVKGVCYTPTKVGESPSQATQRDWMTVDDDHDGRIDAPYQAWVDKNGNKKRDKNEPEVGDFQLLKEMGCNTIRVYHSASAKPDVQRLHQGKTNSENLYNHAPNKELLRDLFKTYGIRVAMGDFFGAYTVATSAPYDVGTDYRDPAQRKAILKSVEAMVREHKDEPYLLLWILGNENFYDELTHTNARAARVEFATLVNEAVKLIHKLDGKHPVAISDADTKGLATLAEYAPDLDIYGSNAYRGPGFGPFWKSVARKMDKPVLFTEYGTGYPRVKDGDIDQDFQANEHEACWKDIEAHRPENFPNGPAIGGFVFEWVDQWWFLGSAFEHDLNVGLQTLNPEGHGITSQGNGSASPFLRQLRKVYRVYQALWKP